MFNNMSKKQIDAIVILNTRHNLKTWVNNMVSREPKFLGRNSIYRLMRERGYEYNKKYSVWTNS